MANRLSRRQFLSRAGSSVAATTILAACGNSQAIETPTKGPSQPAAGAAPTAAGQPTVAPAAQATPAAGQPTAAAKPTTQATAAAAPQPAMAQVPRNETLIASV